MKKILLSLMMAMTAFIASAQTIGEQMYLYHGDRVINGFIPSDIDSITWSYYDKDSVLYDEIVSQLIHTSDSVYLYPINEIDSVSFVRPTTIYKEGTVVLEGEIRQYIVSSDGFNLTLSSNTPSRLMPKVGDRLVSMSPDNQFPYYFAGEVLKKTSTDEGILLTCDTLEFEDVVEQFADIIQAGSLSDEEGVESRKRQSPNHASTPWIPLSLPSFSNSHEFDIDIRPIPEIEKIESEIKVGSGVEFSIVPKAKAKLTWFIKGGLFVSGIMVMDNSFSWTHHFCGGVDVHKEKSFLPTPAQGLIGTSPFGWYLDVGWFASLSGSLVWKNTIEKKTRTVLSFIYDRVHPENNMAKKTNRLLSDTDDISGKLYGDITAEGGLYAEAGVSLVRKEVVKVGARVSIGVRGEVSNLRLWEGIDNASKSPEFYDNIKDIEIGLTPFIRLGGVWGVAEGLPIGLSGDFLTTDIVPFKKHTYHAVPSFVDFKAERIENQKTTVQAYAALQHQVLLPVGVGFTAYNNERKRVSTGYLSKNYSFLNQFPSASLELKNVPTNSKYLVSPMIKLFGYEVMASPEVELPIEFPVEITNFKVKISEYKDNEFYNNGSYYDYAYYAATTVVLKNNEGIANWGYVYEDPNGKPARISLKSFGTSYTDTRYAYYRNTKQSTVTLYPFVQYEGDSGYYYGEKQTFELIYKSPCPDSNHPHMIDLGFPSGTKWACCNVGADTPEGYGGYYAWGETEEKDVYDEATYQFYIKVVEAEDEDGNLYWVDDYGNKYDDDDNVFYGDGEYYYYQNIGNSICGTQYDVAHVKWGGSWQMPSLEHIKELINNCSFTSSQAGIGVWFTGPNGNSVLLPYALNKEGSGRADQYVPGIYRTGTQNPNYSDFPYVLSFFGSSYIEWDATYLNTTGFPVRPVAK